MSLVIDLYRQSQGIMDELRQQAQNLDVTLSAWMLQDYNAVNVSVWLNECKFRFDNKEKYTEFALKWL